MVGIVEFRCGDPITAETVAWLRYGDWLIHSPDGGAEMPVTFEEGVGGLGSGLVIVKRDGADYGADIRKLRFVCRSNISHCHTNLAVG